MMSYGLWSLGGKLVTVAMAGYLFSLAHARGMQEAVAAWQTVLAAAVGR